MIDGIDHLVALYGDQATFVKAFVEQTLFLPPAVVQARNRELIALYKTQGKFSIRYSPAYNGALRVKNKAEAIAADTATRSAATTLPGVHSQD